MHPEERCVYIPDVALADKDTSVVNGLGKTELVDTGLETALQKVLNLESQDVIKLHAGLVEHTDAHETANEGVAFEKAFGILLVEGQERTAHVSTLRYAKSEISNCTYRAARRILERVNWTRQTSRLLRRPYSPTSFSSVSLIQH
jgi:hypothetical protein